MLYLHDDDTEQQLFDIWLHKPIEQSFSDFKAEMMPTRTTTRTKSEEELLAFESQFISDTGGGTQ